MIGIQMKGQGVSIRKLVVNVSFRFFNNIQTRQLKIHLQGSNRLLRDRSLLIRKSYMSKKQFLIPVPQREVIG